MITRTLLSGLLVAATLASSAASAAPALGTQQGAQPTSPLVQSVQWGPGWGHRWRGRPYWYARPWVRRPYYGTIVAGVALGTLITVAAVGAVPRRPAPDLCWYWADRWQNRGYWDYCY